MNWLNLKGNGREGANANAHTNINANAHTNANANTNANINAVRLLKYYSAEFDRLDVTDRLNSMLRITQLFITIECVSADIV